ncbi:L-tyrosine/L-tryptophan isonitrile synthase family protein [Bacillus mexicanus]|uniref:L-tyrosine/L-tryptophan isonitrile synthase family protein n=1 Tax=Bacillus mexicanus TaxID=2834415 RepID=UPI003D1D84FE
MKLTELTFDDLKFNSFLNRYNLEIREEDTIADAIFRFLFSDNSVIHLEGSDITPQYIKETYLTKLKKQISKGAPIDFFLTAFSPKFKKQEVSNGRYEPDIAEYITLVHLQMIAKAIREIYPYNFRFIIAFKGDLYERVGGWSKEELDTTFNIVREFNLAAEKLTGTRNSVVLNRWPEMFGDSLGEFETRWTLKTEHYYRLWSDKKAPYFNQIENWKDDFLPLMDVDQTYNEIIDFFLTKEGCRIRAFNNLIFREGKALDLLQKQHPNLLIAHTTKRSKFFNILLNPHFQTRTHSKITIFDNNWEMVPWLDMKNKKISPVFFEEYNFPMFFKKAKKTEI